MNSLLLPLIRFLRDEDGPTSVEYAVMLALVIIVALVSITYLGTVTNNTFNAPKLTNALGS